ncbi:barstar family protein [Mannheimia sp. E30BD]|uniref:barstar family protein n=1 Tax=Mannheimia sp. E30BD TaxID=3278708 RepID=UPI00359EE4B3
MTVKAPDSASIHASAILSYKDQYVECFANFRSKPTACFGTSEDARTIGVIQGGWKMEVVIDLHQIKSPHDFYDQLTKQVDFGAFFGNNLNAFWDYIGLLEEKNIFY